MPENRRPVGREGSRGQKSRPRAYCPHGGREGVHFLLSFPSLFRTQRNPFGEARLNGVFRNSQGEVGRKCRPRSPPAFCFPTPISPPGKAGGRTESRGGGEIISNLL